MPVIPAAFFSRKAVQLCRLQPIQQMSRSVSSWHRAAFPTLPAIEKNDHPSDMTATPFDMPYEFLRLR